jgi:CO dehydrogenase nickel-insertion accessory protein CooC1
MLPGLALSLGADPPHVPPLMEAAERDDDGRWRLRRGVGPVRAVQRYSTEAPDGVRLLQAGKVGAEGLPAIMPAIQAYYRVIHRIDRVRTLSAWDVVGDLPAGPRQMAFDWAPYARRLVLVVEPTSQSLLTARRIARIAAQRRAVEVMPVANKVRSRRDVDRVERFLGARVRVAVPADPAVAAAERRGAALLDAAPGAPAVAAVERLADALVAGTLRR